jgi:dihydrofolate reductase
VRKIKSNFFISLDGVVESPDKWHFPYFDDEMGGAVSEGFATADAMLMGRVVYEEWAAYWPEHADEPFGDVMNSMKKYVVSNSLRTAEWQNTELIRGDVAQKLREIKAADGGDIAMSGSATTVRWLLREGLLDQLNLLVHPLVVGDGLARLFPPGEPSNPAEAAERRDVQERRPEPQLRPGEGLGGVCGHARSSAHAHGHPDVRWRRASSESGGRANLQPHGCR